MDNKNKASGNTRRTSGVSKAQLEQANLRIDRLAEKVRKLDAELTILSRQTGFPRLRVKPSPD